MANKEYTVMILKTTGLDEDQIQEEFSEFFNKLVDKYPNQFGVGLASLKQGTEAERTVLEIADL